MSKAPVTILHEYREERERGWVGVRREDEIYEKLS